MRRALELALILTLAATPMAAQKVFLDYDRDADFDSYSTFQWKRSDEDLRDTDPLAHTRVKHAIAYRLAQGERGLTEVDSDPDLFVTYHTAEKENLRVNSSSMSYGGYGAGWYGRGWYGGDYWGAGYGSYSTTVTTYTEGTLVIDVWDARTNQMVWRGLATSVVPAKPAKAQKKLEKALLKMSKEFQKQQKRAAK